MKASKTVVAIAGCLFWITALAAQPRAIDAEKSTMTVRVFKTGLLSGLGHDHEISAPVASGTVDKTTHQVELHIDARALRVMDRGISDKDRAEIQSNMLGQPVLEAEQFPAIVFRGSGAASAGNGAWTVNGSLTLHGQTHPIAVNVQEKSDHYTGVSRLKQSDFGITPIKVAGGTIRVKDEIQIEFDIQLAR